MIVVQRRPRSAVLENGSVNGKKPWPLTYPLIFVSQKINAVMSVRFPWSLKVLKSAWISHIQIQGRYKSLKLIMVLKSPWRVLKFCYRIFKFFWSRSRPFFFYSGPFLVHTLMGLYCYQWNIITVGYWLLFNNMIVWHLENMLRLAVCMYCNEWCIANYMVLFTLVDLQSQWQCMGRSPKQWKFVLEGA